MGLFGNAAPANEEIILAPGTIYVYESGTLHGFHLPVQAQRPYMVADEEVPARQ